MNLNTTSGSTFSLTNTYTSYINHLSKFEWNIYQDDFRIDILLNQQIYYINNPNATKPTRTLETMFSLTNTYNIYMIPDMRIVFNTSLMFIISKLIVQINATNALLNQHMQYLHEPCFRFKCYKCDKCDYNFGINALLNQPMQYLHEPCFKML